MTLPVGTFTFYSNLENCPHKAFRVYIAKDLGPRVESPEMKWGIEVHEGFERRLKNAVPLPPKMLGGEPYAFMIANLQKDHGGLVEEKLAIDKNGNPCGYWDDPWFRGKSDAVVFAQQPAAWIVDWKTGKTREEPFELETNALLVKAHYQHLELIVGEYFWLQTGKPGIRYTLTDFSKTFGKLQALRAEAEGYDSAGEWPKRKNPLCGWCDVLDCQHNTKLRRK